MKEFEKINDIINSNNQELIYYTFFKFFLEFPEQSKKLIESFKCDVKDIYKIYKLSNKILSLNKTQLKTREIIEEFTTSQENYKEILKECRKLALTLKLENSLEIANLYTYLLWNGYFSEDKKLTYQRNDRLNIPGLYSYDIINGKGVCLNFSDMLSDYINEFEEYGAATLINTLGKDFKRNYKVEILRNSIKKTIPQKLIAQLLNPYIKRTGNHTYNLIRENDNLYIYDSTNLSILDIINNKKALFVNGKGKSEIKPYLSYFLNPTEKSIKTLDLLQTTSEFSSAYNINDFILSWDYCLDLFQRNKYVLDDFYSQIEKNINNISKNNSSIKLIIKEYDRGNI